MLYALLLSAFVFASAPYDVPLDPASPAPDDIRVAEVRDTVFEAPAGLLDREGVIDLSAPPATMPSVAVRPLGPVSIQTAETDRAIMAEVSARES